MCNPSQELSNLGSSIDDAVIAPVVEAGSQLDDFVNEAIPGGWLTVALATGMYYGAEAIAAGNAAESAALAEGATAAEAAAAGQSAANAAQAGIAGGVEGGTGLISGSGGAGFTTGATAPELATMGGGTGLTTSAAGGGTLSAAGVTGAGAVPMLGEAGSIINNPATLGTDVVGATKASPIGLKQAVDAARAANSIRNLLGQPTAQIPSMQRNIKPYGSVQYPSLSLLEMRPIQRPTSLV